MGKRIILVVRFNYFQLYLRKPMLRSFAAALISLFIAVTPVLAAEPFTDAQKKAMESAIKQYIMDNPQVLITSVEGYYNKQTESKKAQQGPLTQLPAGLVDSPSDPYAGDKDAKITVVEFFDYNCGYCKQVASDLERVINEEKDIKVVFKELPILSESSKLAARYALAANKQGKYLPYHMALLKHQGGVDETFLAEAAKTAGLDFDKLKKDADGQDVIDILNKNIDLARDLGVQGTPFFVIGKEKVPGAIGYSRMKEMIAKERGGSPAAAVPVTAPTAAAAAPEAAPAAAPTPTLAADATVSADPDTQQAIEKANAEAMAMIEEIKAEAAKMQADAAATKKEAEKKLREINEAEAAKAAEKKK